VLTKEIAAFDQWGEAEIRDRGRRLAKEASEIWIGPAEAPVKPQVQPETTDDDEPTRYEIRQQFWAGLIDHLESTRPELPDFEARTSWAIRLQSGIRHIGVELRFSLRNSLVGLDVWFWRDASMPLWVKIKADPGAFNELVHETWVFDRSENRERGRMYLNHEIDGLRNPDTWPAAYQWLGDRLAAFYTTLAPRLRLEMDQITVKS
jgi:hypothetical protein